MIQPSVKNKIVTLVLFLLGVCSTPSDDPDSIILLDCQKGRWDFPDLKKNSSRRI